MKIDKHIGKYIAATLLLLFISMGSVFAQVTKSKGTRITDDLSVKTSELKMNAILDLDSTTKGFFLPRMTTVQRDAIVKAAGSSNGLAIYNIDIDCVEYWSERTQKWMSVCGSLPPATLDIADGACGEAKFFGIKHLDVNDAWQQGKPFDNNGSQYLQIEVKVESVGTYQVSATTDNGYFFSAEGQFQAVGTYQLILKASGTPVNGYEQTGAKKGDVIKFNFNGKVSAGCPNLELKIIPADLKFKIDNIGPAKGTYNVFLQADKAKGNVIEVDVTTTMKGTATITAYNTPLGVKFMGTKKLVAGTDKIILEPVLGECAPTDNAAGMYDLTIETNVSDANLGLKKSTIAILPTFIKGIGNEATFGVAPYYQGSPVTGDNTIELPIEVKSSGKSNLLLKGGNIELEAKNVELRMPTNPGDKQKVTFTAKAGGMLPEATTLGLKLSGDGVKFSIDPTSVDVTIPLAKKPVAYTINCGSAAANRGAIPLNKAIGESYFITIDVNVTEKGEYEINTNTPANGILFSTTRAGVKQVFGATGPQKVKLYAIDGTKVANVKGITDVQFVTTDGTGQECTGNFPVKVGFNPLRVLVAGTDLYGGSQLVAFFKEKNSKGDYRFDETGKYSETGPVTVKLHTYTPGITPGVVASNAVISAQFTADLNSNDYDLVMLDSYYLLINNDVAVALENYIKRDKGYVFYTTQLPSVNDGLYPWTGASQDYFSWGAFTGSGYQNLLTQLVKRMNGGASMNMNGNKASYTSAKLVLTADPMFMAKPKGIAYTNKNIAWSAQYFYLNVAPSSSFETVVGQSATQGTILRHKTYKKFLWLPIFNQDYWSREFLSGLIWDKSKKEIFQTGDTNPNTETGAFFVNTIIYIADEIANR